MAEKSLQVLLALAAVFATGCNLSGSAGPCYHEYRDPVLLLEVRGSGRAGPVLSGVAVTAITIDGRPMVPAELSKPPSRGVTVSGDTLICQAGCGFGTSEGRYTMTLGLQGYRPATVQVDARYETSKGGCPSYNAGPTRFTTALAPEG